MPALPTVPGVTKAIIKYSAPDHHSAVNRLYYHYTGGTPTVSDLQDFASAIYTQFATLFATTSYDGGATLDSVEVEDLASSSGLIGIHTASTAGGGSTQAPASSAILVNWKIARRYRGGKPKMYLPFLANAALTGDNTISSTALGNAQSTANILCGTTSGLLPHLHGSITWDALVNVSFYSGFTNYTKSSGRESSKPTLRSSPVVDTVVSAVVSPQQHTQRRRLLPS